MHSNEGAQRTGRAARRSERIMEIKRFFDEHGNLPTLLSDKRLSKFCSNLRHEYKHKKDRLSPQDLDILDEIGFWVNKKTTSATSYELKLYFEEHGHFDVAKSENARLAAFVRRVRYAYHNRDAGGNGTAWKFSGETVSELESIGFTWAFTHRAAPQAARQSFESRIEDLKKYKQKHGHLDILRGEDQSLFDFCNNVRYGRKCPSKGMKITDDRAKALDEIGFPWKASRNESNTTVNKNSGRTMKSFESRLKDLRQYKQQYGHLNVTREEDQSLFFYCSNVRYGRNHPDKGMKITDERVKALDEIGFPWEVSRKVARKFPTRRRQMKSSEATEARFEDRLEDLRQYKQQHGHLNVKIDENKSLYYFCRNVRSGRSHFDRGINGRGIKITDERVKALDEIGFPWKGICVIGAEVTSFEERLDELRKYKHRHGHTNVRWADDISLAAFCSKLRFARKTKKFQFDPTDAKIAALDSIGFDWFGA